MQEEHAVALAVRGEDLAALTFRSLYDVSALDKELIMLSWLELELWVL